MLNNSNISSIKIGKSDLHMLLYADDMVLADADADDLQEKIRLVEKYFVDNGLTVNLQKTKVVAFQNGNRRRCKPKAF
jgi:hypothetical protein